MNQYIDDIKRKTAGMDWRGTCGYILTYYWYHILGIVAVPVLVVVFAVHFLFGAKAPLFSCAVINQITDDARDDRLAGGYAKWAGLADDRVLIDSNYNFSYEGVRLQGVNESDYEKFFFKWSNSEWDAVIFEEDFYQYCKKMNGTFRSLDMFDTGTLALYEDDGVNTAIVLSGQDVIRPLRQTGSEKLLLAFPANGMHEQQCQGFINYIESGGLDDRE